MGCYSKCNHLSNYHFVAMCMMCKMFGKTKSIKPALECIPYILMSAVAFCVPYIICAMFLGPEFPSLIGALIALVICIVTAKKGILVPKSNLNSRRVPNGMQHGNLQQQKKQNRQKLKISCGSKISPVMAWVPYGLIAIIPCCDTYSTAGY